jgi:hypothetical protein
MSDNSSDPVLYLRTPPSDTKNLSVSVVAAAIELILAPPTNACSVPFQLYLITCE